MSFLLYCKAKIVARKPNRTISARISMFYQVNLAIEQRKFSFLFLFASVKYKRSAWVSCRNTFFLKNFDGHFSDTSLFRQDTFPTNFRKSVMSEKWPVGKVSCRKSYLSEKWSVGKVFCRKIVPAPNFGVQWHIFRRRRCQKI